MNTNKFVCSLLGVVLFAINPQDGYAELPHTQTLIRKEILRLGGEWEGSAFPKRICFSGRNFMSSHFEMLDHCTELEWLGFYEIVDCAAIDLKHLVTLHHMKRLDFYMSDCLHKGIGLLVNCRSLEEIRIESKSMDSLVLRPLKQLKSLRKLILTADTLDDTCLMSLAELNQLVLLELRTDESVSDAKREMLSKRLPHCEITW